MQIMSLISKYRTLWKRIFTNYDAKMHKITNISKENAKIIYTEKR